MLTTINNNKYKKICTLDTIHVKKRQNTELRHTTEMLSMVIKDLWLHKCPLLSRISSNQSLRQLGLRNLLP